MPRTQSFSSRSDTKSFARSKQMMARKKTAQASRIASNERFKRMLQKAPEVKFFNAGRSGNFTAPTDASGGELDPSTLNTLFAPTQGDGDSNREGKKTLVTNVFVDGNVSTAMSMDSADQLDGNLIFIALVLDTQTKGAQLNSEDVFQNPLGLAAGAANPLRNLLNSKRFLVLDHVTIERPQLTAFTDGTNTGSRGGWRSRFTLGWDSKKSGRPIQVNYLANGGTVADIQDNSFHIVGFCTSTTGVTSIAYNARTRFVG